MSNNIGKKLIKLPSNIKISIFKYPQFNKLILQFQNNFQQLNYPKELQISINNNELQIINNNNKYNSYWGLLRSMIESIILGITEGYTKRIILKGVGYRFQESTQPNTILIYVGYTIPIQYTISNKIQYKIINNTTLEAKSKNLQELTNELNKIRLFKPADKDHYKGKGIIIE